MSFSAEQFRGLIDDTLRVFSEQINKPSLHTKDAVELLMMTAAQETHLGKYLKQIRGPALGVFQMEPRTYVDLFANYISHKTELHDALELWSAPNMPFDIKMRGCIPYQIIIARLYYLRIPEALPSKSDGLDMAHYYKKYWNTKLGKATPMEAYRNYIKYCVV